IGLPSHLTVVLPSLVFAERAIFGYGVGMGPPGLGVLQISSCVLAMPTLPWWTTVSGGFTQTLTGIHALPARQRGRGPRLRSEIPSILHDTRRSPAFGRNREPRYRGGLRFQMDRAARFPESSLAAMAA